MQKKRKTVTGGLFVIFTGIYPASVSYPDLLGLADKDVRIIGKKLHLPAKLLGKPEVIGVQEGDPFAVRVQDAEISRRAHPPMFTAYIVDFTGQRSQSPRGIIGRTVIDDYYLHLLSEIFLIQNGTYRFGKKHGTVKSRNYHTNHCL